MKVRKKNERNKIIKKENKNINKKQQKRQHLKLSIIKITTKIQQRIGDEFHLRKTVSLLYCIRKSSAIDQTA